MEAAKQRSRTTRVLLAGSVTTVCLFSYNTLSIQSRTDAHIEDLLQGRCLAPEQYRIGVIGAAAWITQHTGLAMFRSLSLLLCASVIFASFCLLRLLEQRPTFRDASNTVQWLGSAAFIVLFQYYMAWLNFYERPETLPSTAILTAMLWLWSVPSDRMRSGVRKSLAAVALVLLACMFGFIRAEIAITASAGVWIVCLMGRGEELSLGRNWAMATSAAAAAAAGAILLYLMRVVYPNATYGAIKKFMLPFNLTQPRAWVVFAVFMLPLALLPAATRRLRKTDDVPGTAMLYGAGLFSLLWIGMGKIDEVRIFLPFAVTLIPLTVEVFLHVVTTEQRG